MTDHVVEQLWRWAAIDGQTIAVLILADHIRRALAVGAVDRPGVVARRISDVWMLRAPGGGGGA